MEGGKGPSIWDTFTHLHPGRYILIYIYIYIINYSLPFSIAWGEHTNSRAFNFIES